MKTDCLNTEMFLEGVQFKKMQRREFILELIQNASPLLVASSLSGSCTSKLVKPNGKRGIVIGAGISGLAAAKKLKENGFEVLLLESNTKVGGRISTDNSLGFAFDEGASWIHGPNGNPISNIAKLAGAKTFLTSDDSSSVFDVNGKQYDDSNLSSSETQFNNAIDDVRKSGKQTQSFQTVCNGLFPTKTNDRLWKYMLSAYLEFDTGADISELSSVYFDDDDTFKGEDVIITDGYEKVTKYIANGLDIRLNTKVESVDYTGSKITVLANNSTLECDYVLVTVPLGVLKKNVISFKPSLPTTKQAAIANTNMGNVNKFLLQFNTPFWDLNIQYIGFTPEMKGKFNYFLNMRKFSTSNALMTFAFGEYATITETMTDSQIINEIMLHLKSIYGNTIPNPTHLLRTKWGQNPHSFGAYSYATNGSTSADFDTMAAEIGNKLFFAGEHTNKQYRGTVHGAYLSGIREAEKMIALI